MQVNVESASELRRKLTIELSAEEIEQELDQAYRELGRQIRLKGFRPGRAPRRLLERFFGDQIRGEVIQKLIRESTEKALADHSLEPVAEPEIVTEDADFPRTLRFSAIFDLKPQIVVKDYEGLPIEVPEVQVTDDEVSAALERLRERHAVLKKVENRTQVEEGDVVMAQLEARADGAAIAQVPSQPQLLEVSERALRQDLYELLKGASLGEPKRMVKTYPEDYPDEHLRGKTVEWIATVKDILQRKLPELDDEFAKDLGTFENLHELREHTRQTLLEEARERAREQARSKALEMLLERNPVEPPQSLVERELRRLEAENTVVLEAGGVSAQQAAERVREQRETLARLARRRVCEALIVDALAEQEKIEVSDDELAQRVALLVSRAGRERDRVARFYAQEENREALRKLLRREKTLQWVVDRRKPAAPSPNVEAS